MNTPPSDGILAIWREGEVRGASPLTQATQEKLHMLGDAGLHAVVAGVFETRNYKLGAEWHTPGENYLTNSALAWRLGEISCQCPGLHVLVYRGASGREIFELQSGVRVGYSLLAARGRDLAGVEHPGRDTALEHARVTAQGQLFMPVPGWNIVMPQDLAELANPHHGVMADVIELPLGRAAA